ncbi:hypothetical protein JXQ70_18745 [bacterium]|nr:hypothetical protein [bacterium]
MWSNIIRGGRKYQFIKATGVDPSLIILLLEEIEESQHRGDEISKSNIRLTAWKLEDENIGKKLWFIEQQGHEWQIKGSKVIITSHGCCDNPDSVYFYNLISGELISSGK